MLQSIELKMRPRKGNALASFHQHQPDKEQQRVPYLTWLQHNVLGQGGLEQFHN